MRVSFAFLCDNAFIGDDSRLFISGVWRSIEAAEVPKTLEHATIVFELLMDREEASRLSNVQVQCRGPDGDAIYAASTELSFLEPPAKGNVILHNVVRMGSLELLNHGDHEIWVSVNDEHVGSGFFLVKAPTSREGESDEDAAGDDQG